MRTDPKFLIAIPTYNEKENVASLCEQILALGINTDLLFIDDRSPDGTGEILDNLARMHPDVRVLHRPSKLGVGSAHKEGIQWAYEHGYTDLVTMDCDFTHSPDYIVEILKHDCDVVIGSRYLEKRSLPGWNLMRKTLTWIGHALTRSLLGMRYDATGALRYYRLDNIPRELFSLVRSTGYGFFFESLYILTRNGIAVEEIPVSLPSRTYGHSKMTIREVLRSVRLLIKLFRTRLVNPRACMPGRPNGPLKQDEHRQENDWEQYWMSRKGFGRRIYSTIASAYRTLIIQPALTSFVKQNFPLGAKVLHAGCGSGQVDRVIRRRLSIVAMDISRNALRLYSKTNELAVCLRADLFRIPLADECLDGLYNLGVMEHFSADEIQLILREFARVIRPRGRLIIFWPPEYGVSVVFLKMVNFVIKGIFRSKAPPLHPEEITRIRSRPHALRIFEAAGFGVISYHFGVRDLFTHAVIVAQKVMPEGVQSEPTSQFESESDLILRPSGTSAA